MRPSARHCTSNGSSMAIPISSSPNSAHADTTTTGTVSAPIWCTSATGSVSSHAVTNRCVCLTYCCGTELVEIRSHRPRIITISFTSRCASARVSASTFRAVPIPHSDPSYSSAASRATSSSDRDSIEISRSGRLCVVSKKHSASPASISSVYGVVLVTRLKWSLKAYGTSTASRSAAVTAASSFSGFDELPSGQRICDSVHMISARMSPASFHHSVVPSL
mmetsp:Transcript_1858/g.4994  ORF Transcript_1858/g.4994 Transcript_1858/m.4994 type:complete len:221 (+) Transcript_1858:912-1574(+)